MVISRRALFSADMYLKHEKLEHFMFGFKVMYEEGYVSNMPKCIFHAHIQSTHTGESGKIVCKQAAGCHCLLGRQRKPMH